MRDSYKKEKILFEGLLKGKVSDFQYFYINRNSTKTQNFCAYYKSNKSTNKLVTILHGTGQSWYYPMALCVSKLLESGFDVCCLDLDGHGYDSSTSLEAEKISACIDDFTKQFKYFDLYLKKYIFAYSLGSCFATQYFNEFGSNLFLKASFWGVPHALNIKYQTVASECRSLFNIEFVKNSVSTYGIYNSLPSLGPFKRTEFPIRISQSNHFNYVKYIQEIFKATHSKELKSAHEIPVQFIFGSEDQLAPSGDFDLFKSIYKNSAIFIQNQATHASLPFQLDCILKMIDFFNE